MGSNPTRPHRASKTDMAVSHKSERLLDKRQVSRLAGLLQRTGLNVARPVEYALPISSGIGKHHHFEPLTGSDARPQHIVFVVEMKNPAVINLVTP